MQETPKKPDVIPANDVEDNKVIAAIGYLWILALVPLLLKKDSPYAQFHGRQGFLLFVISIALWIIGWFPIIGWFAMFVGQIILFVLSVMGIVKALQGERWELPYLAQYAKKITL